tara:strand:- start:333 stop:455 length:123 start_codon:yes stop_codon:yes gene_type:complete
MTYKEYTERQIDNYIHDYESYRLRRIEEAEIEAIEKEMKN